MEAVGLSLLSMSSRVMNHVSNVSSVRSWFYIFPAALNLFTFFCFSASCMNLLKMFGACYNQFVSLPRLPTHCSAADRR